ncbi:MAG: 50S ribosomal protein L30 [Deltaproteobacteria bacterium]|nr:50S ribosomal protein L30 [Deltaproteobacteria bacterium]
MSGLIKVKLVHSGIGRTQRQKDTLRALGLRKLQQERILKDLPSIRGMIQKVLHLVEFEEGAIVKPENKKSNLGYKIVN